MVLDPLSVAGLGLGAASIAVQLLDGVLKGLRRGQEREVFTNASQATSILNMRPRQIKRPEPSSCASKSNTASFSIGLLRLVFEERYLIKNTTTTLALTEFWLLLS